MGLECYMRAKLMREGNNTCRYKKFGTTAKIYICIETEYPIVAALTAQGQSPKKNLHHINTTITNEMIP